jgi:hypothetical protein
MKNNVEPCTQCITVDDEDLVKVRHLKDETHGEGGL